MWRAVRITKVGYEAKKTRRSASREEGGQESRQPPQAGGEAIGPLKQRPRRAQLDCMTEQESSVTELVIGFLIFFLMSAACVGGAWIMNRKMK